MDLTGTPTVNLFFGHMVCMEVGWGWGVGGVGGRGKDRGATIHCPSPTKIMVCADKAAVLDCGVVSMSMSRDIFYILHLNLVLHVPTNIKQTTLPTSCTKIFVLL